MPSLTRRAFRWDLPVEESRPELGGGLFQDVPSYDIPAGGVYDLVDMLTDTAGKLRKRGGTVNVFSGAQTAVGDQIGFVNFPEAAKTSVYVASDVGGVIATYNWNRITGAFRQLTDYVGGNINCVKIGRPFNHLGILVVPMFSDPVSDAAAIQQMPYSLLGGAVGSVHANGFTYAGATATLTAGDPRLVGVGTAFNTDVEAGMFVELQGPSNYYYGRVVRVVDATHIEVTPAPLVAWSASATWNFHNWWHPNNDGYAGQGGFMAAGQVGCSYQNRVLLANGWEYRSGTAQPHTFYQRRLWYSTLPDEGPLMPQNVGKIHDGNFILSATNAFSSFNSFDVPGSEPFTALVPLEKQLLIFSATKVHRVTGNFESQTIQQQPPTIDTSNASTTIGCVDERSIQLTPQGVVFAALDGIYLTDGYKFRPLMSQRYANQWRALLLSGAGVVGSALLQGNHYIVCTDTIGSLCINLDNASLSRFPGLSWFGAVPDPAAVQTPKVFALRWWNTGAGAPSMAGGQVVRADQIMQPSGTNQSDSDGTAVTCSVTTRTYTQGDLSRVKRYVKAMLTLNMQGAGTYTVAIDTRLEAKDSDFSTPILTVSTPTPTGGARVVSINTRRIRRGLGITYKVALTAPTTSFEIESFKHLFVYAPPEVALAS